jgi:hypothetical protein
MTPGSEVVLDLRQGLCTCGCEAATSRRFSRGHDQRLKLQLSRAHRSGDEVVVLIGEARVKAPAMQAATYLDTPTFSWSSWIGGTK